MRLDKFLCKSTDYNRHQAIRAIAQGRVQVNGSTTRSENTQVHENNCILLDGEPLTPRPSRYIMLNKPADTVCSNSDDTYPSLMTLLKFDKTCDLHIAGRLDADTTGLVLITDDGRWSFDIIRPLQQCQKVYRVNLRDAIAADAEEKFQQGIQLQGERALTQPAQLNVIHPQEVLLTITEGKYHQVKRMFAAVGNKVTGLHREKIGALTLDVDIGQWRYLTAAEVASFHS